MEADTFHLCLKQIGHDTDRIRVWKQKYASFYSGIYFKKIDWLRLRNDEIQTEAKRLIYAFVTITVLEPSNQEWMHIILKFRRDISNNIVFTQKWHCKLGVP